MSKENTETEMVEYNEPRDIPSCGCYSLWTEYGEDYDCQYDINWTCDECLVNWEIGGYKDPRTPEKYVNEMTNKG